MATLTPSTPLAGAVAHLGPAGATADSATAVKDLIAAVTFNPASGASQVPPDTPVAVHTTKGKLTSVALTTGSNPPLPGVLSSDGKSWQVAQGLAALHALSAGGRGDGDLGGQGHHHRDLPDHGRSDDHACHRHPR